MLGWGAALSAEGARLEESGEGQAPPCSRLGGLGERRKLPQRGPGQSPGRQRFWYIIGLQNDAGGTKIITIYSCKLLCFHLLRQPCSSDILLNEN